MSMGLIRDERHGGRLAVLTRVGIAQILIIGASYQRPAAPPGGTALSSLLLPALDE